MEGVGIFPDKQELSYKLCRMMHSRMMGTIITSNGSKNSAAEINATRGCLPFCSTVQ